MTTGKNIWGIALTLTAGAMTLPLLTGCSDTLEEGYYPASSNSLLLRVSSGTNMSLGSYNAVSILEVESNTEWTLTAESGGSGVSWLHLGDGASSVSGRGNGSVSVTADANESNGSRSCTLVLAGPDNLRETVNVIQSGTEITVNPGPDQIVHLPSRGGEQTYVVSSSFDWKVTTDASWLEVSPAHGTGSREGTELRLSCGANSLDRDRQATVTISAESDEISSEVRFTIVQNAIDYTFNVSPATVDTPVAAEGGELTFDVFSTTAWRLVNVSYSAGRDWIAATPESGSGNTLTASAVTVAVSPNRMADANGRPVGRSAVLTFASTENQDDQQSVTITQEACQAPLIGRTVLNEMYLTNDTYGVDVYADFVSLGGELGEAWILFTEDPNQPDDAWEREAATFDNPTGGRIRGMVTLPAAPGTWWFKAVAVTKDGVLSQPVQGVIPLRVTTPGAIPSPDDNNPPK